MTWSQALQLSSLTDVARREAVTTADSAELTVFDSRCAASGTARAGTCRDVDTVVTTTCAEFRRLTQSGDGAVSTLRLAALQATDVRCSALDILGGARPAIQSTLRGFHLNTAAVDSLPPILGVTLTPGDSARAFDDTRRRLSWRQSEPEMVVVADSNAIEGARLRVRTATGSTLVTVLGRGDFDGDGWDDLMLRVTNQPRGGTLVEDEVMVLGRTQPRMVLRVIRTR